MAMGVTVALNLLVTSASCSIEQPLMSAVDDELVLGMAKGNTGHQMCATL